MDNSNEVKIYSSDWLGSHPYFYNTVTYTHSDNINDVIDKNAVEIDEAGAYGYMVAGYCICGRTPVKNVRMLLPNSTLYRDASGRLYEKKDPDPALQLLDIRLSADDIFELMREKIQHWEKMHDSLIFIPTSGGYDSRLLNYFVKDKSRIRSATYGISGIQSASYEVQIAKRLSGRLGTNWRQIELGHYLTLLDSWYALYGVSTHAHGMYHMEFYHNFLAQVHEPCRLLSGLIGDIWAGMILPPITSPEDCRNLFYTHGICIPPHLLRIRDNSLLEGFFAKNKNRLQEPRLRVVAAMRFKMALLSYLLRVPESLGLQPYAPYIEPELAMAMLNLPQKLREGRVWQSKFLLEKGIYFPRGAYSSENVLNLYAATLHPWKPYGETMLQFVQPTVLDAVNLVGCNQDMYKLALQGRALPPVVYEILAKAGIPITENHPGIKARQVMFMLFNMCAVLYPLEKLFKK